MVTELCTVTRKLLKERSLGKFPDIGMLYEVVEDHDETDGPGLCSGGQ